MNSEEHGQRVREGLERARSEGKRLGRPITKEDGMSPEMLMVFADRGYSIRRCAKVFSVSRMTIVRRLRAVGREEEFIDRYKKSSRGDKAGVNEDE